MAAECQEEGNGYEKTSTLKSEAAIFKRGPLLLGVNGFFHPYEFDMRFQIMSSLIVMNAAL